jgi:hypothetical protein
MRDLTIAQPRSETAMGPGPLATGLDDQDWPRPRPEIWSAAS